MRDGRRLGLGDGAAGGGLGFERGFGGEFGFHFLVWGEVVDTLSSGRAWRSCCGMLFSGVDNWSMCSTGWTVVDFVVSTGKGFVRRG